MISIRTERPADVGAREALLDAAYGPTRHAKPSARLRNGRLPAEGLSFVGVERGRIIGSVRLWHVGAGRMRPALLLGPLAVHPAKRRQGIGAALMRRAIEEAKRHGHRAVLLVGNASYYGRFGFGAAKTGGLWLDGAYDQARLLAIELVPGALDGAQGLITAAGRREPVPALAALVPLAAKTRSRLLSRAA